MKIPLVLPTPRWVAFWSMSKQYIEQSQINAARAWHHAGYSCTAIALALRLAPGTIRRAIEDASDSAPEFGKTQLPAAWTKALSAPFPKSYVTNLAGVYGKFLRRMAIQPPISLPTLVDLLLPCTFPSWQLPEWMAHYNRQRSIRRKVGLMHYNIMKAWTAAQQTQAQTPPPSSAPTLYGTPPRNCRAVLSCLPQPPPEVLP